MLNALISKNHIVKKQGFTLVELMVTIAVVAILSAIALPSMNNFLIKMRVDNEITEMQRLLLTARNVAINSGINTSVCPLNDDGDACSGTNSWLGIIGVVNTDGVLKEKSALKAGDQLQFNSATIVYTPTGQTSTDTAGSFSYCPKGYTEENRGIDVSSSGRVYSSSDTDNDGKDENRAGGEISCSS